MELSLFICATVMSRNVSYPSQFSSGSLLDMNEARGRRGGGGIVMATRIYFDLSGSIMFPVVRHSKVVRVEESASRWSEIKLNLKRVDFQWKLKT